jgi:hypothetical protein
LPTALLGIALGGRGHNWRYHIHTERKHGKSTDGEKEALVHRG